MNFIKKDHKLILIIIATIVAFYFLVMVLWNVTNKSNKPTNLFWDIKKEGYVENPLHDRYGE